MAYRLEVGEVWGRLRLDSISREPLTYTNHIGTYETDEEGPETYKLVCECGNAIEIERVKFPGKRRMRNCQKPDCMFADEFKPKAEKAEVRRTIGRPPLRTGIKTTLQIQIPVVLLERLDAHALKSQQSRTRVTVDLLDAALSLLTEGE